MAYKLKAQFFPTTEGQGAFIGSAAITVADAVMLRGIAVFRDKTTQALTICFPTFGAHRQSYILPINQSAYNHMHRVIAGAVKEIGFRTYEMPGSTEISFYVAGNLTDGLFSLMIPGFCRLNGITTEETSYTLPSGYRVAVRMPSLKSGVEQGSPVQSLTVFHGLITPKQLPDGTQILKDYQEVINDLVRKKRTELLQDIDQDKPAQESVQRSIPQQKQTIR